MSIESLKGILSPPLTPSNTGDMRGWDELELEIKTSLPNDYKDFISTYGTGGIDNFVWILTPFDQDEYVNFLKRSKVSGDAYLESKQQFPEDFKHKVFPETGGLLLWGYTDNGDELYWLTNDTTDKWTIVVYGTRSSEYYEYDMSLTDFLYKILTRELICEVFPEDFPSEEPKYIFE